MATQTDPVGSPLNFEAFVIPETSLLTSLNNNHLATQLTSYFL